MGGRRGFYLDRRLGVGQPPGFPFNLNSAVDALLKKEFDQYRAEAKPHPMMIQHGIDAVPYAHEKLEEWRDSLRRGVQYLHPQTNLLITGGVDDLWHDSQRRLIIVDYKATSKNGPISIEADWQIGYKRQMSLYAWLFKMNGFQVAETGYFVYCNGLTKRDRFDQRLDFDIAVLPYQIDDSWVEKAILDAHQCLNSESIPPFSPDCDFCQFVQATRTFE